MKAENANDTLTKAREWLMASLPGANPAANTPDAQGRVAGFWLGLWHGIIAPTMFVISLFSDKAHVFEVHNNGKGYIGGFLLGLMMMSGGRAAAARRPRPGS
jgi:hypothetical protein